MLYCVIVTPTPPRFAGFDQLRVTKLFSAPIVEVSCCGAEGIVAAKIVDVSE